MTTWKGIYYFPTFSAARAYAVGHNHPTDTHHYVVCRNERGENSGPGHGVAYPNTVEVMAASRTEAGAKRKLRTLGGFIRRVEGPYRRYAQNEPL